MPAKLLKTRALVSLLSAHPQARHPYVVTVAHPPYARWKQTLLAQLKTPLHKAVHYPQQLPEGGQWILLFPNGRGQGYPVYVLFDKDGVATIVAGAANALNGLRIYGLKTEEELLQHARNQQQQQHAQEFLSLLQPQPQPDAFARQQRQTARLYLQEKHQRETLTLHTLLTLLGLKPSAFDIPEEIYVGLPLEQQHLARTLNHWENQTWKTGLFSRLRRFLVQRVGVATDALWQGLEILWADALYAPAQTAQDLAALLQISPQAARSLAKKWGLDPVPLCPPAPETTQNALESLRRLRQAHADVEALPLETAAALFEALEEEQAQLVALQEAFPSLFSERNTKTRKNALRLAHIPPASFSVQTPSPKQLLDEAAQAIETVTESAGFLKPLPPNTPIRFDDKDPEPVFSTSLSAGRLFALGEMLAQLKDDPLDPYLVDILGSLGTARLYVQRWRRILSPQVYEVLEKDFRALLQQKRQWMQQRLTKKAQAFLHALLQAPTLDITSHDLTALGLDLQLEKEALLQSTYRELGALIGHLDIVRAFEEAFQTPDEKPFLLFLPQTSEIEASEWLRALGLQGQDYRFLKAKNGHVAQIEPQSLGRLLQTRPNPSPLLPTPLCLGIRLGIEETQLPAHLPLLKDLPATGFEVNTTCMAAWMPFFSYHDLDEMQNLPHQLEQYIGYLVEAGFACWDIAAWITSEIFFLSLWQGPPEKTQEAQRRFLRTVHATLQPQLLRPLLVPEDYRQRRQELARRIFLIGKEYLQAKGHRVSANYRRLQTHYETTRDLLQRLRTEEPDLRVAFLYPSEFTPADLRAARRFAFTTLFRQEQAQPLTEIPLDAQGQTPGTWTQDEHKAFEDWLALEATGTPFLAIQNYLAQTQGQAGPLTQENLTSQVHLLTPQPDPHSPHPLPLWEVALEDPLSLCHFVQSHPKLFADPFPLPDQSVLFPELEGAQNVIEFPHGFVYTAQNFRSDATLPDSLTFQAWQDRIKSLLIQAYCRQRGYNVSPDFRPDRVATYCPQWEAFCDYVGNEEEAYRFVREQALAVFLDRFIPLFNRQTQEPLRTGEVPLKDLVFPAELTLPASLEGRLLSGAMKERAALRARDRGRFLPGSVQERWQQQQYERVFFENLPDPLKDEIQRFFQTKLLRRTRLTIGVESEALLGNLFRGHLSQETPRWRRECGFAALRYRATRLISAQRKLALLGLKGQAKILTVVASVGTLFQQNDLQRFLVLTDSLGLCHYLTELSRSFEPPDKPFGALVLSPETPTAQRHAAYADGSLRFLVADLETFLQDLSEALQKNSRLPFDSALARLGWAFDSVYIENPLRLQEQTQSLQLLTRFTATTWSTAVLFPQENLDTLEEIALTLSVLDPQRYPLEERSQFLTRYRKMTPATRLALKREVTPYFYGGAFGLGPDTPAVRVGCYLTQQEHQQIQQWQQQVHGWQHAYERGEIDLPALAQTWPWVRTREDAERLLQDLPAWSERRTVELVAVAPEGAKVRWLRRFLQDHPDSRVLVLTTLRHVAQKLASLFQHQESRCGLLLQEQSDKEREKTLQAFESGPQNDGLGLLFATDAACLGYSVRTPHFLVFWDVPEQLLTYRCRYDRVWGRSAHYVVQAFELVSEAQAEQKRYRQLVGRQHLVQLTPYELYDETGGWLWVEKRRLQRLKTFFAS